MTELSYYLPQGEDYEGMVRTYLPYSTLRYPSILPYHTLTPAPTPTPAPVHQVSRVPFKSICGLLLFKSAVGRLCQSAPH